MHIQDIFRRDGATYSFEFFPPKTAEGAEVLFREIVELEQLRPSFVSVTYGAGGSTRDLTHDLVLRIQKDTPTPAVPHLTCVCHQEEEIRSVLERYAKAGVSNILALAGDPPRERAGWDRSKDAFQHAAQLVAFIKKFSAGGGHPDPRGFGIGVAGFPEGHPGTPNRLLEMDYLKAKVDAGADYIVTQLFFENRDFYDFQERCELAGIKVPVIAGLMPVTSGKGLRRMAELASCTRFPAKLLRAIERCGGDEDAVARVGIHWATAQAADLIDHKAAGIHFYTLNKSGATREIYRSLGVADSGGLR